MVVFVTSSICELGPHGVPDVCVAGDIPNIARLLNFAAWFVVEDPPIRFYLF